MDQEVTVWYDEEGDYLEVLFAQKKGYFRETNNDAVMEKIDETGNIIGFSRNSLSDTYIRRDIHCGSIGRVRRSLLTSLMAGYGMFLAGNF